MNRAITTLWTTRAGIGLIFIKALLLSGGALAEVPWITSPRAGAQKPPNWEAAKAVSLKAEDLIGVWHGVTIARDYYYLWEIEYQEGGKYVIKTFTRTFAEEEGKHEDSEETIRGTWKIREDGVMISDEGQKKDGDKGVEEYWCKPIGRSSEKIAYLTVFPREEDALATVIYEFRGKAPAVLRDLPPVLSSDFKK